MEILKLALDFIKVVLSPLIKVLKWVYGKLPFRVIPKKPLPKLGIIESSWKKHIWENAKQGDKEIVAIHTYWRITNTLPYNLTALNVFLTKPQKVKGSLFIKHHESDIYGSYTIPKGYTTDVHASFVIDKECVKRPNDTIKARIEFQDPLGRLHKIERAVIGPVKKAPVNKKDKLRIEDPSKIKNKVERKVVAVLKNEVEQYKARGRREGRLGTVEWPKGAIEWRGADEKIKFLFETSNAGNVTSEHIAALLDLYKSSSQKNKKVIIRVLLDRIDKKSEYRNVGYLIIFFLFEIDHLEAGLDAALTKLKGDKVNAFGDVLRMLDFLLAFRYEDFKESQLDATEAFVYSTKEHTFRIKERINAIRVRKMLEKSDK